MCYISVEHIAKYLAMRAAMEDDNADHSAGMITVMKVFIGIIV
jgi:hypothetical protein